MASKPVVSVSFLFAWYDLWIGAYWDRKNRTLYVLPIPCCGVVIRFARVTVSELRDCDTE